MRIHCALLAVLLAFSIPGHLSAEGSSRAHGSLWIDMYRGEPVPFGTMIGDIAVADIVYIGEAHTIARHHREQLRVIEGLQARGKTIMLGLEQMESHYQTVLDRYNSGGIGFDDLAVLTRWSERWSNYSDYRPLLESVHAAGGTVLALNARNELVRETARAGRQGITGPMREELPEPFTAGPRYEKYIKKLLMVHSFVNEKSLQRVFEAQALRDDAMSRTIIRALKDPVSSGKIMLIAAGATHVAYGLGIPARVRSILPDMAERILVLSQSGELELGDAERKAARELDMGHDGLKFLSVPIADYLMVTDSCHEDGRK